MLHNHQNSKNKKNIIKCWQGCEENSHKLLMRNYVLLHHLGAQSGATNKANYCNQTTMILGLHPRENLHF